MRTIIIVVIISVCCDNRVGSLPTFSRQPSFITDASDKKSILVRHPNRQYNVILLLNESAMTTFEADDNLEGEAGERSELSEIKSLLQRAEQRMRNLDPASKRTMKATNAYK